MNIVIDNELYVADFDGTSLEQCFEALDGSTRCVQAADTDSGLVCVLAQTDGHSLGRTELEARYMLAKYIYEHRTPAT